LYDLLAREGFAQGITLVQELCSQREDGRGGLFGLDGFVVFLGTFSTIYRKLIEIFPVKSVTIARWEGLNLPYQIKLIEIFPVRRGPLWYRNGSGCWSVWSDSASFLAAETKKATWRRRTRLNETEEPLFNLINTNRISKMCLDSFNWKKEAEKVTAVWSEWGGYL